jgi:hypothetical protein
MRLAVPSLLLALALPTLSAAGEHDAALAEAVRRGDVAAMRETLAAIARASSIDASAATFAAVVESLPRNRAFRAAFERALASPGAAIPGADRYLFVFVPGWLYWRQPESGADFARPRRAIGEFGFAHRLAEIDENGTVDENAAILAGELASLRDDGRRVVLVSTSKGGPETLAALDRLRESERADHIAAWVNIGGLLNGTVLADRETVWPRSWLAAIGFAFMGLDTASISSMTTDASRKRFASAALPPRVLVVNYLGVPRASDVTSRAQEGYETLAEHGPNDGLTLLADAIVPGGTTLLERGLDHYFVTPDLDERVAALARAVIWAVEARR